MKLKNKKQKVESKEENLLQRKWFDLLNFGRTFMHGQILTISCVLVVVENKLRYYGKFQSF